MIEQWNTITLFFERSLELPSELRQPYLDRACGINTDLRREVDALLAAYDEEPAVWEHPLDQPRPSTTTSAGEE